MKDWKHVAVFVALGLAVAYFAAAPLRDNTPEPEIGSPLRGEGLYAEGTVALDAGISADPSAVLFVIARPASGGPPVAVKRFDYPRFPLQFALSRADNMVGEDFFDGDLQVIARLDKDGAAGPAQPEDREASAAVTAGGNRQLDLIIRNAAPEPAPMDRR